MASVEIVFYAVETPLKKPITRKRYKKINKKMIFG